jgi:hypothetical protein
MKTAALLALADAADALARLVRALAKETSTNPEELAPRRDAARFAATSPRVIRDAIRLGDLPAYGSQRDRPFAVATSGSGLRAIRGVHESGGSSIPYSPEHGMNFVSMTTSSIHISIALADCVGK